MATRVGIARSTLRTWDKRYGLGPSLRSAGGHRRYTEADVARLELMSRLLETGVPAAQSAYIARRSADEPRERLPPVQQVVGGRRRPRTTVASLLRAARDLQADELSRTFLLQLQRRGVVGAWNDVFVPFLTELGRLWSTGRIGVESEHLASGVLTAELRAFASLHGGRRTVDERVVLACAEQDQHALPLCAVEAALAERRIGSLMLGQRLPAEALSRAVRVRRPDVVLIWASLPLAADVVPWPAGSRPLCTLLLGGPGWDVMKPRGNMRRVHDLHSAVAFVESALLAA